MFNDKQRQQLDDLVEKCSDRVEDWADRDDLFYRAGCIACDWIEADGVNEYADLIPDELSQQAIGYIGGRYCDPSFHTLTRNEAQKETYYCYAKEA